MVIYSKSHDHNNTVPKLYSVTSPSGMIKITLCIHLSGVGMWGEGGGGTGVHVLINRRIKNALQISLTYTQPSTPMPILLPTPLYFICIMTL